MRFPRSEVRPSAHDATTCLTRRAQASVRMEDHEGRSPSLLLKLAGEQRGGEREKSRPTSQERAPFSFLATTHERTTNATGSILPSIKSISLLVAFCFQPFSPPTLIYNTTQARI